MKRIIIFAALILFITTGCKESQELKDNHSTKNDSMQHEQKEETNRNIAAVVNGTAIFEDEINNISLEKAIENELLYQKAIEDGIDKKIDAKIKDYKRNLIINTFREKLKTEEPKITDNDINEYYKKNKGSYITVLVNELIIEDKNLAEEAYSRALAGEDFDKLIEEYRTKGKAHSHVKGDPNYKNKFLDKPQGAVEMFEHPEGYKIAKLNEKHAIPMSRIRKFIISKLKNQTGNEKINSQIQKIKNESKIEIVFQKDEKHDQHKQHSMKKTGLTKENFLKDAEQCVNLPHSFKRTQCFQPYFHSVTNQKSVAYTLELASILEKDGIIRDCHMVAHHAGMAVLEKYNYNLEKAFDACTPDCLQGCYHAVLENYVSYAEWEPQEITGKALETCNRISRNKDLENRQCIHGVGHGMVNNYYMPVSDAIGICRQFTDSMRVNACLGGVFMEDANRQILPYEENKMLQHLPFICKSDELGEDILVQKCAHAVGEGVMFYTGHDIEKSKKLCQQLNKEQQDSCIRAAAAMNRTTAKKEN